MVAGRVSSSIKVFKAIMVAGSLISSIEALKVSNGSAIVLSAEANTLSDPAKWESVTQGPNMLRMAYEKGENPRSDDTSYIGDLTWTNFYLSSLLVGVAHVKGCVDE